MSHTGKILKVNLSRGETSVDKPDEKFYRRYMGGSAIGAYYLLKETPAGADPLGEKNALVISTSVVTGAPVSGFSRANITAKSPLTGGIGDAQFGGNFPVELKKAGYDAIVITGKSDRPVYLDIRKGQAEIRDASEFWGLDTGDAVDKIKEKLDENKLKILAIGKAGENLVKYASAINEKVFAAGRTGMGAVMGAKKLKAIAVTGEGGSLEFSDKIFLKKMGKEAYKRLQKHGALSQVAKKGSSVAIDWQNEAGGLPTRNFRSGVFAGHAKISGENIFETIHTGKRHTCYGCVIACKQQVGADEPYQIDYEYGCPEYETSSALGSYLMIDDLYIIAKANELCNRYGMDTISVGANIAFMMECHEKGLLEKSDYAGLELNFGDGQILLKLIHKIASREGIGDLLAESLNNIADEIGGGAENFAMQVKGNPFPAHMPRVKQSMALSYAINSFGADHCSSGHDSMIDPSVPEKAKKSLRSLGLLEDLPSVGLEGKVRFYYYTQNIYGLFDTLEICNRAAGLFSYPEIVEITRGCTGWETSLWELLKAGERRNNMLRAFNAREGFSSKDDKLPERIFEPIEEGPRKGSKINREELKSALQDYYQMAGWDINSGNPTRVKLIELDLEWIAEML